MGDLLVKSARKILGVFSLLVATCIATSALTPYFLTAYNVENLLRRTSLFGVISIGAAFVIIVGGIDLSIGSVVALVGCLLPWLLVEHGVPIW
ncbi:MAG: ABC transporter permease, partial [Phycisphaeraceae bacterium]|nr:ABC transporter permease [Phycisphaeraceae bacterium]